MKRLFFLFSAFTLTLFVLSATAADGTTHYCNDPEVNQQWDEALRSYPDDPLVLKLSAVRTGLCGMVDAGEIPIAKAKTLWENALTSALLERARAEQAKRGLLRLFGTF